MSVTKQDGEPFDEGDPAVMRMIACLITEVHEHRTSVGFCGEVPSVPSEYAGFLVEQ
jgi:phosphoenolpyruvate-protein kinase (PTS system EI component)